jgi:ATP-dependent RNA helicase SUPV3L1/SUV3
MLLCGFEKFNNFYVRIDILERLFMKIISTDLKDLKEIKMTAEMLNLLGCSRDDFTKLLKLMNYKIIKKNNDIFFKYIPEKKIKKIKNKIMKENPFKILKNLNLN